MKKIMAVFFILLLPVAVSAIEKPLTIGISYNQVMANLNQFITMSKSSDVNGQTRYMGQTSDYLTMLEIIGNKRDISQATLMIGIPNDIPRETLIRNSTIYLKFIKNITPHSNSSWATPALQRVLSTGNTETIIKGSKLIKLSFNQYMGMLIVTVNHKDKI